MSFEGIHSVHLLGIGGIGMSALARWFRHEGYVVSGYDRSPSPLIDELIAEGMEVGFEDSLECIPEEVKSHPAKSLIVWTPALPKDSQQLNFFQENKYKLQKRSEVLGVLTSSYYTIAVAGTHGKTTTSSMIAHLLKSAGKPVAAFLGGITQNYQSNLILGKKKSKGQKLVVVEADEFDRSFLRLHPNEAVITSADADHLDIYGDEQHILDGFIAFTELLDKKGKIYIQQNALLRLTEERLPKVIKKEYGLRSSGIHAENIQAKPGFFVFDYVDSKQDIKGLELYIPGFHNVENALAAIAIALDHGLSEKEIRKGLSSFKGVKRRFEIHVNEGGQVYIDDYAHHPEEIRACLSSVRAMFPAKQLTVVFQPHLFSRTRDFADEFSESLSLADAVILLDIYPARELPIAGVTSEMLLEKINSSDKILLGKNDLMQHLDQASTEVLVTMGAGDIDRLVPEIASWMKNRINPLAV
ncbi:UDP-N-acetylmuramate--L-alanine ligase [Algoriphagus halophytocola]|uniref:UDP-N-acetylmuramate--L-alanine ligase n=1 Tax=Algoriphagus halophytocola TaxID=2991499 RepID=A0ABY6MFG0_9BACT|nr:MULTISPECIES: UDP-N-acetylmuramate--L-alanine ligase [unclassified Algoriphagus]UZD21071.1 UDP-N-acetylmuramate--L-alanine ligase [Algoriphagus sp. TR-M5]WBL42237.1 UDP-N-acetylmuramate--L-alanine ligase [Algoriphagus sp. TR-M9]